MQPSSHTIWKAPAYLPYLQPPLTAELIASAEDKIGYKLPLAYLDLLKSQNGGYIRYHLPGILHSLIAGIGPNFPSITTHDWTEEQEYVDYKLDGLVPLDGDGHWYLCLDDQKTPKCPAITYVDLECQHRRLIARSFTDYIKKLKWGVSSSWVRQYLIHSSLTTEQIVAKLQVELSITFDPPSDFNHGYLSYRGMLPPKPAANRSRPPTRPTTKLPVSKGDVQQAGDLPIPERPKFLWISSNTVPRGFLRPTDPRYPELKSLLPGVTKRIPWVPKGAHILELAPGTVQVLRSACSRAGLRMEKLTVPSRGSTQNL